MTGQGHRLTLVLVTMVTVTSLVAAIHEPTGCVYDYNEGIFTCDYRSCLPLNGSEFIPPPQRLVINNIYGTFTPTDFVEFANANITALDTNYDATLTLECYWGSGPSSLLTFNETTFDGFTWYKNVHIKYCEIEYLIPRAFQYLETLNFLGFEGGYINYVSAEAMQGLNIEPDPTAVVPLGELSFIDVDLIVGGFKNGFLDPLENMTILTVKHSRFVILLNDAFKNLHRVHTLVLDDNPFTYLPQEAFRNMTSLNRVSVENIAWACGCGNMWFIPEWNRLGISLLSEANCATPENAAGMRGENFWEDYCAENVCETGSIPAIDLGVVCLTYLQIAIYTMALIGFFQMIFIMILCWRVRKKVIGSAVQQSDGVRVMTPRKAPPRMAAPVSHAVTMKNAINKFKKPIAQARYLGGAGKAGGESKA